MVSVQLLAVASSVGAQTPAGTPEPPAVSFANLRTTKTGPATIGPGGLVRYVIKTGNTGKRTATDVVVTDTLPASVTFVSASNGGVLVGNVITWPVIPALAFDEVRTFTVVVRAPDSGQFTNIAASSSPTPDSNPSDNDGSAKSSRVTTTVYVEHPPGPVPSADVEVTKTGPATILGNGVVSYVVTVRNLGPNPAANVIVSDTLPAGAVVATASGSPVVVGQVVTWPAIASLAVGATQAFSLTITPPAGTQFTNIAAATSATADPDLSNNNGSQTTGRVTTAREPAADVITTKSGPATVAPNGQVDYTLTVSNAGPDPALDLVVTDTLPAGVAFVSATAGGTSSGGVVSWPAVASLAPGATITLGLRVTAPAAGSFTNIAASSSSTADPDPASNDGSRPAARVTTVVVAGPPPPPPVVEADIEVTKTGPATVVGQGAVSYAVTVRNLGPDPAADVIVTDTLPPGAAVTAVSGGGVVAGGVVTWPAIASLAAGASTIYTLTITPPAGSQFTNVAAGTSATPDPDPSNNNGSQTTGRVTTTRQPVADVITTKTGPASVSPNGQVDYTLTVRNAGPDPAQAVVVTDTLPAGVTFSSASAGGTRSGQVVTWPAIASLASGGVVTFSLTVLAPAAGTFTNIAASTSSTIDPDPASNDGSRPAARVTTVVTPVPPPPPPPAPAEADIAVAKTGPATVVGNGTVSYTVTVRNLGPDQAANVIVTDTLPVGASVTAVSGGGVIVGRVVTWPAIALLPNGASHSFTLTIAPPADLEFTNAAAAVSTTADPDPANNRGSQHTRRVTTNVGAVADVVTTKTGPATVAPAGQVVYTISVRNDGPDTAVDVTLTDTLPAAVVFGSASGGGTLTGRVISWPVIAFLASGASQTFTVTVTAPATGTFTNVAASTAASTDPDASNNDGSATGRVTTTVNDQTDIEATKTAPASVDPGGTVNYLLTVTNHGPGPARDVVIRDTLPAAVVPGFVSASDGGVLTGAVVVWPPIPQLDAGQSVTRSIVVRAPVAGSFTNVVAATSTTPDPDPDNNNGSRPAARPTTTVRPIDVAIAKSHSGDFIAGTVASYTIAVTNVGSTSTVGPLKVTDTLPGTLRPRSATGTGWNCTISAQVVSCSYPAVLAPTQVASFAITVDVLAAAAPRVTNRAVVATIGDEAPIGNNVALDEAVVSGLSPLVLEKRVRPAEVEVGDVVDYRLLLSNVAGASVPAVIITDTLPMGFVYLKGSARLDGQPIGDPAGSPGPVLRIPVGDVAGNTTRVVSYRLLVGAGAPAGNGENRAIARSEPTGVESPIAVARVRFRASLLSDRAFIVGKVAVRADSAGSRRDVGIPGVRVVLSDGTTAITDEEGKYSFPALPPLLHIVRVDETTLPRGVRLPVTGTRQAGTASSRFADLRNGELHRADFIADSASQSVLADIGARRGSPVTAAIPDTQAVTIAANPAAPVGERLGDVAAAVRADPVPDSPSVRVVVGVPAVPVPADGHSIVAVRVQVAVVDGPAGRLIPLTLEATAGRWLVADRDSVEPGIQTETSGGAEATFGLVAPLEDGLIDVRVTAAGQAATVRIAFMPAPRPVIATGLIQGRIDLRSLARGALVATTAADGFERELRDLATTSDDGLDRASARGALYLRGKVQGKYLLTAAFDSERDPERRFFRDIQPEEFYPVYGDASIREYGAQSIGRLYVRVDHERSFALVGDYTTPDATEGRELGAYLRTLTGVTQHLETDRVRANLFAARSENRQVVDEFPGRGISGPYPLSRPNGLLNTERVELLTRDRNQPARILSIETLRRFADYSLEPFTGRLLFRRPVPSVDASLNPVSIRVSYELEQGGDSRWTWGGDAQLKVGGPVEIGGSAVRQDDPLDSFSLWSLNGAVRLDERTTVLAEYARTGGNARESGDAGRIEFRHNSAAADLHLFAATSDSAFNNPSSTFGGGRRELGGLLGLRLDPRTRLVGQALRTEDLRSDGRRDGALLAVERALSRDVRLELGYRYGSQTAAPSDSLAPGVATDVHALHSRLAVDFGDSLAGGLRRGTVFGEYDQDVANADRRRGSLGAQYQLLPRLRAYGRHEFLSSFSGPFGLNSEQRTQATVFGLDAGYAEDGTVFSEYRLRDGFSGREGEAVIGLRNRWPLARGVRFDASFERIHPTEGRTAMLGEATSVTGGLELLAGANTRATARLEFRDAPTGDSWLATLGYAQRLSTDWTALGRFLWNDAGLNQVRTRTQLGLAWRQTERSTWNGLGRFERRFERIDAGDGLGRTRHATSLLSAHANWQPAGNLVINGRWTTKWAADSTPGGDTSTRTNLAMVRAVRDLGLSWDLGLQGSLLAANQGGGRRFGLGGELGRRVVDDLRLALGYNIFGFRDRDLRETEYTIKGLYLRLDYKFDEGLFAR